MKNHKNLYLLPFIFLFTQCQLTNTDEVPTPAETTPVKLGQIDIDVTGSDAAMPFFEEGLLLLHSFEFEDAAEKFVEAQQVDSNFVMAYWGEAMSKNKPLWNVQQTNQGRAALNKLAPTPEGRAAKATTPLEKDLLRGAEILFGEGKKLEKDDWYKDHMATLYKKYPDNHEVAAFYALSLLGSVEEGRDYEVYGKGAIIAKGILEENPNHPGALHYLIHSYDDPDHATMALDAANSYSRVASGAGHALHMPSHIYIAMGMWKEVIESNIASWEASVARMKKKGQDHNDSGYHALKWLMYGYLQQGDYEKARSTLAIMEQYHQDNPTKRARAHMVMMQGAYLTETQQWDDPIAQLAIDEEDLSVNVLAIKRYLEGVQQFNANDAKSLQQTLTTMQKARVNAKNQIFTKGAKMCSGGSYQGVPTQVDVNQAEVMEMELQAMSAMLSNDKAKVKEWLEKAILLEKNTNFSFGPPMIVKPAPELYAEWLLKEKNIEAAQRQFEEVLTRAPNRLLAQKGLTLCKEQRKN